VQAGAATTEEPLYKYFARNFSKDGKLPDKFSLPVPMANILNGGKHAGGDLKLQEFMIMPKSGQKFSESIRQVRVFLWPALLVS
jgi:enolase 1/2/3